MITLTVRTVPVYAFNSFLVFVSIFFIQYIISDGDELKDDLSSKVSTCSPDLDADRPGLQDDGPSQALSEKSWSSQPSETPRGKRQQGEEEEKDQEEEDVHPTPLEAQQETVNAAVEAALETKTARVAVQYLSVVDRARQLGLDKLVELFEKKLEFHRNRQAKGADVGERSENGESDENGESSDDGDISEKGDVSEIEYVSDFDSDFVEDM